MQRRRKAGHRRVLIGILFVVVLALGLGALIGWLSASGGSHGASGASSTTASLPPTTTTLPPQDCTIGAELVPKCGAYWGAYSPRGWRQFENLIGRKLAIVHEYSPWPAIFPTKAESAASASGSLLLVNWTLRESNLTFSSVAAGLGDAQLDREAAAIKAFGKPIMLGFEAEPERANPGVGGTAADFVAAWRHIHDVFHALGVRNVIWVWDVTGDVVEYGSEYPAYYPGDAYVDWIMWDPYNWFGCRNHNPAWRSFGTIVSSMYNWLTSHSGKPGNGDYLSKPWGLGEYGTVEGSEPSWKAQWFQDEISELQEYFPRLKALLYFDSVDNRSQPACRWIVDSSENSLAGYISAGRQKYVSYLPFATDSDFLLVPNKSRRDS